MLSLLRGGVVKRHSHGGVDGQHRDFSLPEPATKTGKADSETNCFAMITWPMASNEITQAGRHGIGPNAAGQTTTNQAAVSWMLIYEGHQPPQPFSCIPPVRERDKAFVFQ